MNIKFSKLDIETIDFIQIQITMNENCDSYGMTNFEEKRIMFDRANTLLQRLAALIIENQK